MISLQKNSHDAGLNVLRIVPGLTARLLIPGLSLLLLAGCPVEQEFSQAGFGDRTHAVSSNVSSSNNPVEYSGNNRRGKLIERFNQFDQNRDGILTNDEVKRPQLFNKLDQNADGSITLQEASDYIEQRQATRRASYAPAQRDRVGDNIPERHWTTTPVPASYPVRRAWRQAPIDIDPDPSSDIRGRYAASAPGSERPLRLARDGDDPSTTDVSSDNRQTNPVAASGEIRPFRNLPYATIPGVDPNLLSLDVYAPATGQNHPVIVMVHGGGWQRGDKSNTGVAADKARYLVRAGYLFVSINYRLSPAVKHPAHVQDVAKALAWVRRNIGNYGGNPQRIYLMGHSAGAHLAALVATDPRYLQAVGESLSLLKGVIVLDGAGYDIPRLMREHNQPDIYIQAFGNDERVWEDASPVTHIASGKNIPPFLIFYTPRTRSQILTESLRQSLMSAGIPARIKMVNKSHAQINREVGQFDDDVTQSIMEFLR